MVKTRLLPAFCGIALLAAAPAFAQSDATSSGVGANPGNETMSQRAMPSHSMHKSGHHMMESHKSSRDNSADQLNEQSYQAAMHGQTFMGTGGSDMHPPTGASPAGRGAGPSTPPPGTGPAGGMQDKM